MTEKDAEDKFHKSAEELASLIVKDLEEGYNGKFESFEVYSARKKREIVHNLEIFRDRFSNGYKVILDEIAEDKGLPTEERS